MANSTAIGNYTVISELAYGAFGRVYRAHHSVLTDRTVALKLMQHMPLNSSEEKEQFFQEARFLEVLRHPYILPILDVGIHEGAPYLVSEYAPGGSLRDRLRMAGSRPLPQDEALKILAQIGQALSYVHRRGVIHRDLKPENILFNANGDALLADFGLATMLATASVKDVSNAGTPNYMSPEQFQGEVGKESDQYALGCIAYELFTGQRVFTAPNPMALMFKHIAEEPIAPAEYNQDIPTHIEEAILKALAKERKNRHEDINTFIAALHIPGAIQASLATPRPSSTDLRLSEKTPVVEKTGETDKSEETEETEAAMTLPAQSSSAFAPVQRQEREHQEQPQPQPDLVSPPTVLAPPPIGAGITAKYATGTSSRIRTGFTGKLSAAPRWLFMVVAAVAAISLISASLVFAFQPPHSPHATTSLSLPQTNATQTATSALQATAGASPSATVNPTRTPTPQPAASQASTKTNSSTSTHKPTSVPTISPTQAPAVQPTPDPTLGITPVQPTPDPTLPPTPDPTAVPLPNLTVSPTSYVNDFGSNTPCSGITTHGGVGPDDASCPITLTNSSQTASLNWSYTSTSAPYTVTATSGTLPPGQSVTVDFMGNIQCPGDVTLTFSGPGNTVQVPVVCTAIATSPDSTTFSKSSCTHNADGTWTCEVDVESDSHNPINTPWTVLDENNAGVTFSPANGTLAPGAGEMVTVTIPSTDCSDMFHFYVPGGQVIYTTALNWAC